MRENNNPSFERGHNKMFPFVEIVYGLDVVRVEMELTEWLQVELYLFSPVLCIIQFGVISLG